jgi:hypothetical protein
MRIPKFKLVQIFLEEIMDVYTNYREAKDPTSEGGRDVTRGEIWIIMTTLICSLGLKLEKAILEHNGQSTQNSLRWEICQILMEELSKLPNEIEEAVSPSSEGGQAITKEEAINIIQMIMATTGPKIVQVVSDRLE